MKKEILFIVLMIILLFPSLTFAKNIILPLSFQNKGNSDIDYLSDIIQSNIFSFFNKINDYSIINPEKVNLYINKYHYKNFDFTDMELLNKIGKNFNADYILKGKYYEKNNSLYIHFEVIDLTEKKIVYRFVNSGSGGIQALETIDVICKIMVEDFTGTKFTLGVLDIKALEECEIYIDNEKFGKTPFKSKIISGSHNLTVIFKKENINYIIYDNIINVDVDKALELYFKVYYNLIINTDEECILYLNEREIGKTPYNNKIITGRDYALKIVYNDRKSFQEKIVKIISLKSTQNDDITLDLSVNGDIFVDQGKHKYFTSINFKREKIITPHSFNKIAPGNYRIKLLLKDKQWKRYYCYYDKLHNLLPGEKKKINSDSIEYRPRYVFFLLPSAYQFYNREYIKGPLLISLFSSSLISGLSLLITSYAYFQIEYKNRGINDDYGLAVLRYSNNMFWTSVGLGIFALAVWIYSIIDGAVYMNRMYKIFYPEFKRIKVVFKLL